MERQLVRPVKWGDLHREEFDQLVRLLLNQLHPEARFQAIDGAGGDGGRDAVLMEDDRGYRRIYQWKSFVGRITGSQKRQIKRSLKTAVVHLPREWVLIVPIDLTGGELAWFEELRQQYRDQAEITYRGVSWLDSQMAQHPAVQRSLLSTQEEIYDAARELNVEHGVLAGGAPDLMARHQQLIRRGDEVSPHYQLVPITGLGGHPGVEVRPKHRMATEMAPINITVTAEFPPGDPEADRLRRQYQRMVDFGTSITLPGRYVRSLEVDAPPELGLGTRPEQLERLVITALPETRGLPIPAALRVRNEDGASLASLPIEFTERTVGHRGAVLYGRDDQEIVRVESSLSLVDNSVVVNLQHKLPEHLPIASKLLPFRIFEAALAAGSTLELELDGHAGALVMDLAQVDRERLDTENAEILRDLTADLALIQERLGPVFRVPDTWTPTDVKVTRRVAGLLREEIVEFPGGTAPLRPNPDMIEWLLEAAEGYCRMWLPLPEMTFEIAGYKIRVPWVSVLSDRGRITDTAELEEFAQSGRTDTPPLVVFKTGRPAWLRHHPDGQMTPPADDSWPVPSAVSEADPPR